MFLYTLEMREGELSEIYLGLMEYKQKQKQCAWIMTIESIISLRIPSPVLNVEVEMGSHRSNGVRNIHFLAFVE